MLFSQWDFERKHGGESHLGYTSSGTLVFNFVINFGHKHIFQSFFCGQHPVCLRYGDQRGVKLALQNVEKHFRLVGLMEQYEDFLIRAEHIIPLFFNGGPTAYKNMVASGAKCKPSFS